MGPSRVLHLMNPLRHDFIASCLEESSPASSSDQPGLRYLDVGCGGGIFAESLARTLASRPSSSSSSAAAAAATAPSRTNAASILAIDPSADLIEIARNHARRDPTLVEHMRTGRFRYENTTLESLSAEVEASESKEKSDQGSSALSSDGRFDVITLFEVIEHVDPSTSSPRAFLTHCFRLLRPGGWLVGSTIARTVPSFVVNKMIAEAPWPLGVVPPGTHEWSKFVNADELRGWAEEGLMRACDGPASRAGAAALEGMKWKCAGVVYFPGWGWKMVDGGEDWGNYFWAVRRGV